MKKGVQARHGLDTLSLGTHDDARSVTPQLSAQAGLTPLDFAEYLPWACRELNVPVNLRITKVYQDAYAGSAHETKPAIRSKSLVAPPTTVASATTADGSETAFKSSRCVAGGAKGEDVDVVAEYDANDELTHLKFIDNKTIPRGVVQIVALIAPFHRRLRALSLRRGVGAPLLRHVCRLLAVSTITDVSIENCPLEEGRFYVLLESKCPIKYLSLRRCSVDDAAVEAISSRLAPPSAAAKSLIVLDLSSNRITDEGARSLARALRTNRKLSYLSLMNNAIGDDGAAALLDTLVPFPLTAREFASTQTRHAQYIAYKSALVVRAMLEMKQDESEKNKSLKRLQPMPSPHAARGKSSKTPLPRSRSQNAAAAAQQRHFAQYERAKAKIEAIVGDFQDPLSSRHTQTVSGWPHSRGNHAISYLNLAYNNVTVATVRRLTRVVSRQRASLGPSAAAGGLVCVNVEGNAFPRECRELRVLDEALHCVISASIVSRASPAAKRPKRS